MTNLFKFKFFFIIIFLITCPVSSLGRTNKCVKWFTKKIHSISPGFKKVKISRNKLNNKSYCKFNYQESGIGNQVQAEFIHNEKGLVKVEGVVIDEYPAGFTVYDQVNDKIVSINTNESKIQSVKAMASEFEPKKVASSNIFELIKQLDSYNSPYGLIQLYVNNKKVYLFGAISVDETIPFRKIIEIKESSGLTHKVDPAEYSLWIHPTLFEKNEKAISAFSFNNNKAIEITESKNKRKTSEKLIDFIEEIPNERVQKLPKRVTADQVSKVLTESQRISFIRNLEFMGISKEKYNFDNFGTFAEWELFLYHGVSVVKNQSPAKRELTEILVTEYKNTVEFKLALNNWSKVHSLGYQFFFYEDIKKIGKNWIASGYLPVSPSEPIIGPNGFIMNDVYNKMSSLKMFPIADPHDPLGHLASITEPIFRENFNRYTNLNVKIANEINARSYEMERKIENFLKSNVQKEFLWLKSYVALSDFLLGSVRNMTHENWTYIVRNEVGESEFFFQGNAPFNGFINILNRNEEVFVQRILNLSGRNQESFALDKLIKLPKLNEFVDYNKENEKLLLRLRGLFEQHALSKKSYEEASKKLLDLIKRNNLFKKELGNRMKIDEAQEVLNSLATFVSDDPELMQIFS